MTDTQNRELIQLAHKGFTISYDHAGGFIYIARTTRDHDITVAEVIEAAPSFAEIPDGCLWKDRRNERVVIG